MNNFLKNIKARNVFILTPGLVCPYLDLLGDFQQRVVFFSVLAICVLNVTLAS